MPQTPSQQGFISIHAPLRERPRSACSSEDTRQYFNPRSLAGATLVTMEKLLNCRFQSTLPCGSDRRQKVMRHLTISFQSTLPCGSDFNFLRCSLTASKFQSTLPCGSDHSSSSSEKQPIYFNPRSLAGATVSDEP